MSKISKMVMLLLVVISAFPVVALELHTEFQVDSPPRYYSENGRVGGLCPDIIEALNQRLKKSDIKIVSSLVKVPFSRIMGKLADGAIDVFFCISKNKEREKRYQYGVSLYKTHYAFAALSANPLRDSNLTSLQGKRVCALRHTNSAGKLAMIDGVQPYRTNSLPLCFKMMLVDRLDAIFYHDLGMAWMIKQLQWHENDFTLTKLPLSDHHHHVVFSKSVDPEVVKVIGREIESLKSNGTIAQLLADYRPHHQKSAASY